MIHRKIKTEIITLSAHNYTTKTNQTTLCAVSSLDIFSLKRDYIFDHNSINTHIDCYVLKTVSPL